VASSLACRTNSSPVPTYSNVPEHLRVDNNGSRSNVTPILTSCSRCPDTFQRPIDLCHHRRREMLLEYRNVPTTSTTFDPFGVTTATRRTPRPPDPYQPQDGREHPERMMAWLTP
jgi:hypothetical protein